MKELHGTINSIELGEILMIKETDAAQLEKLSKEMDSIDPLILRLDGYIRKVERYLHEGIGSSEEIAADMENIMIQLQASPITKMVQVLEQY